jgi:hypothetical protein
MSKKPEQLKKNLGKKLKNLLLKTLNENCLVSEEERQQKIKQIILEIKKLNDQ